MSYRSIMLSLLLKKFKKSKNLNDLDARNWIQMIILNKNYLFTKN